MRPVLAFGLALFAAALAGCVGGGEQASIDVGSAPGQATPASQDAGAANNDPNVTEPVSREVEFDVDGAAPAGFWVCSGVQTTGRCVEQVLSDDRFVIPIPHEGPVTAVTATLTFTPVTPNIRGMVLMLRVGTELTGTMLAEGEGPSGVQASTQGIRVNATDELVVMSWPVPDANAAGPIWINPLEQPFHVEGVFTEWLIED